MDKPKKDIVIRPFSHPPIKDYPKFDLPSCPIDVEIGCGVGLHPIIYSQSNSNRFLIAIEHTKDKFQKFERRFKNHDCPKNILPVHANAISWVSQQLEENTVDRFYFLYPNPNPKIGDLKKRWYAMPFMHKVLEVLKPNGEIILATNEKFYRDEAIEYFLGYWNMRLKKERLLSQGFSPRTHFEKKYLARAQTCYDLTFTS